MTRVNEAATVGQRHQSLPSAVADEVRELIIAGTLPPGHRLVERDLAAQLDVSRIPLREAILHLQAEGLVQRLPRRGTAVAALTRADVVDLFDVRESLEPLAAGLAAEHADADALAALHVQLAQAGKATRKREHDAIAKLNTAFHHQIVAAADNALLASMMTPLHSRMRWLFRLLTAGGADPATLCEEHSDIYESIAAGNRKRAERLAREHVVKTREPTLALLDTLEHDAPITLHRPRAGRGRE